MNTCKTLCLALQGFVKIKRRHLFFPTGENKYYTKIIIITKRSVTKKHENFLDLHKHLNVKLHVLAQGPCGPHVISILAVATGSTDCGTDSVHSSRCHSAGGWVHEYHSIYRTNWTEATTLRANPCFIQQIMQYFRSVKIGAAYCTAVLLVLFTATAMLQEY